MTNRSIVVALEARITDFKTKMNDAARVAEDFGRRTNKSLVDNRQRLNDLGSAGQKMGVGLLLGVGLVMRSFSQFDSAMSKVAATGTDARQNLDDLRKTALEVGPALGRGATESAEGIEALLKAGVSARDVIGGGLSGALTLASAGVMDVGDAAEIAATAMVQFKKSGEDVPHIADLLAAGAGKAQGEVSDLAFALKQSGLVASQFGISLEETVGTLSAFASAGLLGSDSGTSFRTMLLRLANPSGKAAETMKQLGIAAYDANGQFVGIANLAEQLKTKMGALSSEQRQAAMATIFGTDAIRAANVLYEQGADGIANWTKQVDQQGYAADVARTKLDNLQGDLKRLASVAEAAFISMGEGGNGPLRGLVQNITGAVEWFGRLPAPIQQGTLAVAGIGGAALLAGGTLIKLATGAAETWKSFRELAPAGSRLSGTLGRVGKFAGIAAVGLAAVAAVGSQSQAAIDSRQASLEDMAQSLADLAKSGGDLDQLDGSLQKVQGRFFFWETGASQVRGVGDAIKQVRDNTNGFLGGLSAFGGALAGLAGQKTALGELQEQFAKIDQSLTSMDATDAQAAFGKIAAAAKDQGVAIEDVVSLFPQYRASLVNTATQLKVTNLSAEDYARWMGGEIPPAVQAAATAQGKLDGSLKGIEGSADDATESMQAMVEQLRNTEDAIIGTSNAQIDFEAAIDDSASAVKRNGKGLDENTKKGRANRQALNQLASAANGYIAKLIETGASSKTVTAAQERARTKFIQTAVAAGMGAKKAKELADKLFGIPKKTTADVNVHLKQPDVSGFLNSIQRRVFANPLYIPFKAQNRIARAYGGPLPGHAPHDRADNVQYWGTPGEWVIQRPTVRKYGDEIMAKFNSGYYSRDVLQRLATGGKVGSSTATSSAPVGVPQSLNGASLRITGIDKVTGYAIAQIDAQMSRR